MEGSIEDQCTGFDTPITSTTTTIPPTTTLPSGARCGQPVTDGAQPMASDCLYILRAAVGSEQCSLECVCDTDGSLAVSASDALLCLKVAVGQTVQLGCSCD